MVIVSVVLIALSVFIAVRGKKKLAVSKQSNVEIINPQQAPPPAIGPDGVPIEAKPSDTVESEKQ